MKIVLLLAIRAVASLGIRVKSTGQPTYTFLSLPHDENVTECHPSRPAPPFVDVWKGRATLFPGAAVIMDIGGNVGADVDMILQTHPQSHVFTFEPIPHYFEILTTKFRGNPHVTVQNVGVADANGQAQFILDAVQGGQGTTGVDHTVHGDKVQVQLRDVQDILTNITSTTGRVPDTLNINCEGCEYAVLQRVVDQGWLGKIHFVQVSWHVAADVADRVAKRCRIEEAFLNSSYKKVFHTTFGWEGWELVQQVA
mmetsp:Transcript_110469/g.236032  ORF Transcript_110469/g.236032 Transcript_110469/m.236032 type:complete len:254 (+) Transcript_110469:52-813(+)